MAPMMPDPSRPRSMPSRRQLLKAAVTSGLFMGVGGLMGLPQPPLVRAETGSKPADIIRLHADIEPLVRLIEDTPRDRLLEDIGKRVRHGLSREALYTALMLAGVRNIQPRPVGFKFHAVMVVYPAYRASSLSPVADRWLPLFWGLDDFKHAQYWDTRQGNWTMAPVNRSRVPTPEQARAAFIQAMDGWDEAAADAAVVGLSRSVTPEEVFNLLCRYGARDFRDIGHKVIYLANAWRLLHTIGWHHAEPIVRSLAYAFLSHDGSNPARRDDPVDRSFRRNLRVVTTIRHDWQNGHTESAATAELLAVLRQADDRGACDAVIALLNRGVAPQSIWDALHSSAVELLMQKPGIVALHAVTTTSAMHAAFRVTRDDGIRRLLLLQNAAFLPLFRGEPAPNGLREIDQLQGIQIERSGPDKIKEIFTDINVDQYRAAGKALAYLESEAPTNPFLDTARQLLVSKGNNAHDYKFTMSVLEDFRHLSPAWRHRYLAASVFMLRSSGDSDNPLIERIRAALTG